MAQGKTLKTVLQITGNVDPSVQKAIQMAASQLNGFSKTASRTGDIIKGILGSQVIMSAANGLKNLAKSGIDYASDLEEVAAVVDTIYGKNAFYINAWAKNTQQAYGLNELAAKNMSSTFAALLKPAKLTDDAILEMSTGLTGLAGDLSAFRNLEPEEVFDKLKSGLMGNTEPMESFGIDMRAGALEAYRLEKGIQTAYKSMSDGEQKTLRYNYMMERLAYVSGMAEEENDNYAASLKNLKSTAQDAAGQVLKSLLPALSNVQVKLQGWIASVDWEAVGDKVGQAVEKVQDVGGKAIAWILKKGGEWKDFFSNLDTSALERLANGVKGILGAFNGGGAAMGILETIESIVKKLITFLVEHADVIVPLVASFMLLAKVVPIIFGIVSAVRTVISVVKTVGLVIKGIGALMVANPVVLVIAAIIGAIIILVKNWSKVKAAFKKFIDWFNQKFPFVGAAIKKVGAVLSAIGSIASGVFNKIKGWASNAAESIKTKWGEAKDWMGEKFAAIGDTAKAVFDKLPPDLQNGLTGMKSALESFKNGDWSEGWKKMKEAAGNILNGLVDIAQSITTKMVEKINEGITWLNEHTFLNIPTIPITAKSLDSGGGSTSKNGPNGKIKTPPMYEKGGLTSGVSLAGEGRAPEWVIPTDSRYRSRAQGLLARAATSLGMTGTTSTNGASISVSYAPTIHAGGTGGGDRAVIAQLLRENALELVAIIKEELERVMGSSFDDQIDMVDLIGG